jgi:hypothetical protein
MIGQRYLNPADRARALHVVGAHVRADGPIFLLLVVFQRHVVRGLTAGAWKASRFACSSAGPILGVTYETLT